MGRRRQRPPVATRTDRISAQDLAQWMRLNDISTAQLANRLGLEYQTVESWLRRYRHTPAWLEQDINFRAQAVPPTLPFWGKRWPAAKTTAPPAELDETKAPFPFTAPSDPPPARDEPDAIDPITGQPIYYEDD